MSDWTDVKDWANEKASGPYDYGIGQRVLALLADIEVSNNVSRALNETLESVCESRDALARAVEQLKAENEELMKTLDRYAPDPSGSKLAAIYAAARGHLRETNIFDESSKSQALDAVFALRKDAERFAYIERDADSGMSKIYGDEWVAVIDAALGQGEQS